MIKEALVYDDNVVTSNDEGNLSERENTPYIKEIIETENDIETINEEITLSENNLSFSDKQVNKLRKVLKRRIPLLGVISITALITAFNTNGGPLIQCLIGSGFILTVPQILVSFRYLLFCKRKVREFSTELNILNKKLKEKELALEDYKSKKNIYNFEKKKEKHLLEFTEAKIKYKDELEEELEKEVKAYKQDKKPKVFVKR